MFDSETISSLGPKIWGILPTELKKLCLLHYSKWKFASGPQRIVHVVYVKYTYKNWISLSFLYVHILFCKVKNFTHINEYVEAVIVNHILPNRNRLLIDIASKEIFLLFNVLFDSDIFWSWCNLLFRKTNIYIFYLF